MASKEKQLVEVEVITYYREYRYYKVSPEEARLLGEGLLSHKPAVEVEKKAHHFVKNRLPEHRECLQDEWDIGTVDFIDPEEDS